MKKKILLIIMIFTFITNVKALTFNVDVTNIENEGNNGTIGSITNIDVANKTVDAYFQDIGDEVSFSITVTNTGDRAGTLRSIDFESGNDKIEYTSNLPENGLAINGNDTNKVIVTAKVKTGAVNGKTSSEVKIKYTYDEGSCPEGEILSEDESMCLCPEGMERNEEGICVKPDTPVVCEDDEIYNSEKKICEKKVIPPTPKPINPSNPKTLDNIILITLLFFVSGLGIYAVMFKKLNTNKKKVTGGVITGVITLALSFTVLASVFGLDNLLSAIVNPITKSKELVVTVNEEIDLIETWDGDCDVTGALTPDNVFNGGSGTESDPYQIKTANQLACFAKSVNEGETYEGKFIKQTKNIKLNDNLNEQAEAGNLSGANLWTAAGGREARTHFDGTYDGDEHIISGLYITTDSSPNEYFRGMFGYAINATFKNVTLSDVYVNSGNNVAALLGYGMENLTLDNVKVYGNVIGASDTAGIVSNFSGNNSSTGTYGKLIIKNTINYANVSAGYAVSGIIHRVEGLMDNSEYNQIVKNSGNEGTLTYNADASGGAGLIGYTYNNNGNTLIENSYNSGDIYARGNRHSLNVNGGLIGDISGLLTMKDSYNKGNFYVKRMVECGGLIGSSMGSRTVIDNCYNSGNMIFEGVEDYLDGVDSSILNDHTGHPEFDSQSVGGIAGNVSNTLIITNSYNTGDLKGPVSYMAGLIGVTNSASYQNEDAIMENCYNTGDIAGRSYVGGLVGSGPPVINKVYNTGELTLFGDIRIGGIVGYNAGDVTNAYNLGNIYVTSYGGGGYAGGICAECKSIRNSYNRGNIYAENSFQFMGGLNGLSTPAYNSYNSGNLTFADSLPSIRTSIIVGGLGGQGTDTNCYNLGNITVNINRGKVNSTSQTITGINAQGKSVNSVNTGSITVNFADSSYLTNSEIFGLAASSTNNSFNAGPISFGSYEVITDASKYFFVSEVTNSNYNSSGNKWNTNPNGVAIGCIGRRNECTLEASQEVGQYTTEDEPDILSIINGDNAFNDELDEDGLPTLKVFNN